MTKRTCAGLLVLSLACATAFSQPVIPEGRDLFVGVWEFCERYNSKDIERYAQFLHDFFVYDDLQIKMGRPSSRENFSLETVMDIDADEYRVQTVQSRKVLFAYTVSVYDFTISNDGGNVKVTLNAGLSCATDKNGNPISNSKWDRSVITNTKEAEQALAQEIADSLSMSDEEYAARRDAVVTDFQFLSYALRNMTDVGKEGFLADCNLLTRPLPVSFPLSSAEKNPLFGISEYAYVLKGSEGSNTFTVYTNNEKLARTKKGGIISIEGTLRNIDYASNGKTTFFSFNDE